MTASIQPKFFALSTVTKRIEEILKPATRKTFWVRAEISGGREKNAHFYCDLVEIDPDGHQVAKIRCTIWRTQLNSIRQKFKKAGLELELENGTEIGLNCNITFSPVYGLAINVLDADPAFAIGILELRRRELLLKLEKENLFETNKKIPVPILPQRIGLITSNHSAASNDFLKTIESSMHGFTVLMANSTMQGEKTEQSICRAFDTLTRLKPDLIVIVRGGGSKTDLSHLDNEAIARRIANSNIPVWTGIGHEIDDSVLDFVANQPFKTPTAVAVAIIEKFDRVESKTTDAAKRIQTTWLFRLSNGQKSLIRWKIGLRQGTRKMLELTKASLQTQFSEMKLSVGRRVSSNREFLIQARSEIVSSSRNVIGEQRQKLVHSKRIVVTSADNRIRFFNSSLAFKTSRFRISRYLEIVSNNTQQVAISHRRLAGKTKQLMGMRRREIKQRRESFREIRYQSRIDHERKALITKQQLVRAADPANNLEKGYSLIYDKSDNLVTTVSKLNPNDKLTICMADGKVKTNVEEINTHER